MYKSVYGGADDNDGRDVTYGNRAAQEISPAEKFDWKTIRLDSTMTMIMWILV